MNSFKIPVKVLDKRVKRGWFWTSYFLTLRFYIHEEDKTSPVAKIGVSIKEFPVDAKTYYEMKLDHKYMATMYVHSDGLAYLQPE